MKAFVLLLGIMLVGFVLFVISVAQMPGASFALPGFAPPTKRTTHPPQIAAGCNTLHAPDPTVTQSCAAQMVLTKDTLLTYCRIHLGISSAEDAFSNCYRRVLRQTKDWPDDTQGQWRWQWPVTWQAAP